MEDTGKCFDCPAGFYLLKAPTVPTDCIQCNNLKSICLGSSQIGPLPGYWRKDNTTDTFLSCPITDNCLGMLAPNYSPIGECSTNYYGPMCTTCMP